MSALLPILKNSRRNCPVNWVPPGRGNLSPSWSGERWRTRPALPGFVTPFTQENASHGYQKKTPKTTTKPAPQKAARNGPTPGPEAPGAARRP